MIVSVIMPLSGNGFGTPEVPTPGLDLHLVKDVNLLITAFVRTMDTKRHDGEE